MKVLRKKTLKKSKRRREFELVFKLVLFEDYKSHA